MMTNRLTSQDWLDHGLRALVCDGPAALKADSLAKRLGVSRGSFYWHFAGLQAFHDELLAHWQSRSTHDIITTLTDKAPEQERLDLLIGRALTVDAPIERAMRSWASQSKRVAAALAAADRERIDYIAGLLIASGLTKAVATDRARLLYWAYLGRMSIADPDAVVDPAAITYLVGAMKGS